MQSENLKISKNGSSLPTNNTDWETIRVKAAVFAKAWQDETREEAEAKTFWDELFKVFGLRRRDLASFEEPVKRLDRNAYGFIDLFWKGVLIAEHKSAGKDLAKAKSQALEYVQALISSGRKAEVPRYLIISDFARIALHDLEGDCTAVFNLEDFPKHVRLFGFLLGQENVALIQTPIDIAAAELLGELHDSLKASGYGEATRENGKNPIERYLIRVLFCLFAEDTGIFEPGSFTTLVQHTQEDGSDLGPMLNHLFEVLQTPDEKRQRNLNATLSGFRYINGGLFAERLPVAEFNAKMRQSLINCGFIDWRHISPAIFGSLFQSVMDSKERRRTGSHYTSEENILKVIKPLFLDNLWAAFERVKRNKTELRKLLSKLATLKFFDPACGCGNFLVVTYREVRKLEIEVLKAMHGTQQVFDIEQLCRVNVDQVFGIEIQEWPALIAEVSLWLMDHLMNIQVSEEFGNYYCRLPLKKAPTIVQGNALRMDWEKVLPANKCNYILGNPPFLGGKLQSTEQKFDLKFAADGCPNVGLLDYVSGWYFKAARYIKKTNIVVGFVSTNSIVQGEQVGLLWDELLTRHKMHIHFAHRSFRWGSEARNKAHVHVIVIGFAAIKPECRRLFDYDRDGNLIAETKPKNINPYLTEGNNVFLKNTIRPICAVPELQMGNQPIDNQHYLFTTEQKDAFLATEPGAAPFFRPWVGSEEFINGKQRWCLWVRDAKPEELARLPQVLERIEAVSKFRKSRPSASTQKLATTPRRFNHEFIPKSRYLVIPEVSSENRFYIPMGFLDAEALPSNLVKVCPDATLFQFGVLTSAMHMAWVRAVCGRLETRYRYSVKLVYNNFPWPLNATPDRKRAIEVAAENVLEMRNNFYREGETLANLYNPLTMPPELADAHRQLDIAVDRAYQTPAFKSERERLKFLFELRESLLAAPAAIAA